MTLTPQELFELTEEERDIQAVMRDFAQNEIAPIASETLEMNKFSKEHFYRTINALKIMEAAGLTLPEEYGGTPISSKAFALFVEELCKIDGALGLSAGATISLVAHPIAVFGTEEQKQLYLPGICAGEIIGAYGQTTPDSGSDVAGITTKAVERDGKWYITGTKRFITNGSEANLALVIARTSPDGHKGLTAFLVDCDKAREAGTLDTSKNEHKIGLHQSPTTEMVFTDCEAESILGELSDGWKIAMATLVGSRATAIWAQAVGIMKGAYDIAAEYTEERTQFGARLDDISRVHDRRINMLAKIHMAEVVGMQAAVLKDKAPPGDSRPYTLQASVAKLVASEYAEQVTSDAIQQLGGAGYMLEAAVGKFWHDARISKIYEGTSDIQEKVIVGELFTAFAPLFLGAVGNFSEEEIKESDLNPIYKAINALDAWPFASVEGHEFLSEISPTSAGASVYGHGLLMGFRKTFLRMLYVLGLGLYKELGMDLGKYVEYFKSTKLPSAWFDLARAYAVLDAAALVIAKLPWDNEELSEEHKNIINECLKEAYSAVKKVEFERILN